MDTDDTFCVISMSTEYDGRAKETMKHHHLKEIRHIEKGSNTDPKH